MNKLKSLKKVLTRHTEFTYKVIKMDGWYGQGLLWSRENGSLIGLLEAYRALPELPETMGGPYYCMEVRCATSSPRRVWGVSETELEELVRYMRKWDATE